MLWGDDLWAQAFPHRPGGQWGNAPACSWPYGAGRQENASDTKGQEHMTVTDVPTRRELTGRPRKHKRPPRVLVLRCDKCGSRVARNGYLKIDKVAVAAHTDGKAPIYWAVFHSKCDSNARTTDYRLRAELFSTTGDLLEATAFLLKNEPWIIETNWHGLIGRVLADTREYADALIDVKRQVQRERKRERERERERELYQEKRNRHNGDLEVLEENDNDDDK